MKLVSYVSDREDKPKGDDVVTGTPKASRSESSHAVFDRLVDYMDRSSSEHPPVEVIDEFEDGRIRVRTGEVMCETNCFSWETAAAEMNMVAAQNRHIKDPVYHFIISWRENEKPTDDQVFDSAVYALKSIGLESHQYVTAIHNDTDNVHCHVAVNRVNPQTYKAANMWNDADTLQKSMRILELHYGFERDNGTWQLNADNQLVRPALHYPSAPQGAAKREIYSDKESLHQYAVDKVRDDINESLRAGTANWKYLHLMLHEKGLGLREQGEGLVVYNFLRPGDPVIKASSVHPVLTKARLEPRYGSYEAPPSFETDDSYDGVYAILESYQPSFHVRDKDVRKERREERAVAREDLKSRYQAYRNSWQKPDLDVRGRYQQVAARYQAMKADVRRSHDDPLLRKLMYRVAEFERMKAMAELRIELRQERQKLAEKGLYRPLAYRPWVEQQALKGDVAAVSQMRGWAYRETRKRRAPDEEKDRIILCGRADDSVVLNPSTHTSRLYRDGTVEYLRDGIVGVVDRGERLKINEAFADYDDTKTFMLAAGLASMKSGERVEIHGDHPFVDRVLETACDFNHRYESQFQVTDHEQLRRYALIDRELYSHGHDSEHQYRASQDAKQYVEVDFSHGPGGSFKP